MKLIILFLFTGCKPVSYMTWQEQLDTFTRHRCIEKHLYLETGAAGLSGWGLVPLFDENNKPKECE